MQQISEMSKAHGQELAYIMINCEDGSEQSIIDELASVREIKEITRTFGSYDMVVKIEASSTSTLREVIACKIRKAAKVFSTTTVVCEH